MATECQPEPDQRLPLGPRAAHILFPLHITVGQDGKITGAGRTIARLFGKGIIGRAFLSVFTVERPRSVNTWDQFLARTGTKLRVNARPGPGELIEMHAVSAPFGASDQGLIIDFSFGPNISSAISRFDLTGHDFRPNDYSIDLVYTLETQRSLLDDSKRLAAALHQAKEEAERKAHLDPVTDIANRRAALLRLDMLLGQSDSCETHALLHLDLDKFKPINDTFGHLTGDEVLKQVARILVQAGGANALPARIGGDEFVLVLPSIKDRGHLDDQINDLIDDICTPLRIGSHSFRVGVSIGVVLFTSADFPTPDKLLQHSDIALYEAKKVGGTFAHITPAMLQKRDDAANLVEDIEIGLERGEFVPHFQLQLDGVSNRIHGVEVLARWERPGRPTLAPGGFMRAATRADLMGPIDESVRAQAISTFAAWRRMGIEPGGISINISPANLRSTDFCETIQDEVFAAGLHPQCIRLELLESILFERADAYLVEQSQRLHDAGFSLILDDFGTGHASIATLVDVPVSMIKIDQSFVMGIDTAPKKRRVVGSMLAMAESLGLRVMAEGVETLTEMNILKHAGCRYFQGYYIARPLPAEATARLLQEWDKTPAANGSAG